ncbi:MAG: glycoside hydrolase family 97 N-terminal domain-containing protein, partial [Candidatus Heimdallarchaeota archaeon]|nr:glycoside hydrolase family 97 N-terminal domain-containing protein [Candidatus Heimdallarchaeota archaeon]
MNIKKLHILLTLVLTLFIFTQCKQDAGGGIDVSSPDGELTATFMLENGVPYYKVNRSGKEIIKTSKLGFKFKNSPPLNQNLANIGVQHSSFDETWVQPWGEVKKIRNHYNELRIQLEETTESPRKINLVF